MRVLFDIVHPADVLFFYRPISLLRERGDELLIMSREKDITCELLNEFSIAHTPASKAGNGILDLAAELFQRNAAIFQATRRFRPNVMIGFGGIAIAHIGWLLGIPAVSFYDSENATLQTRMTWPWISHLYVPESYAGSTPQRRTTRLPGTKELSFLHPSHFAPDKQIAISNGLDPRRENFFIRVVSWRANHDLGKTGWSEEDLRRIVSWLAARGKVHISSETQLPDSLQSYRYNGSLRQIHHLVAHCRLYVGESATMACEAAILATPGVYAGRDFPGYVRELQRRGMLRCVPIESADSLVSVIEEILALSPEGIREARDRYVAQCPDWSVTVVEAVDKHATRAY